MTLIILFHFSSETDLAIKICLIKTVITNAELLQYK